VLHHIFHLGLGQSAAYLNYNRDKTLGPVDNKEPRRKQRGIAESE
jgi:hypothetical protein